MALIHQAVRRRFPRRILQICSNRTNKSSQWTRKKRIFLPRVPEEVPKPVSNDPIDLPLAKEFINSPAHQLFDEWAAPTKSEEIEISKENDENIQLNLKELMAGNFSINSNRILSVGRELRNAHAIKIDDDDELLSFDPGGVRLLICSYDLLGKMPDSRGDGPIAAKESLNEVAHQVLGKMPAPIESTRAEIRNEMTPIRAVLFDLFELQLVFDPGIIDKEVDIVVSLPDKLIDRLREKVRATYPDLGGALLYVNSPGCHSSLGDGDELLCFDPGGEEFLFDYKIESIVARDELKDVFKSQLIHDPRVAAIGIEVDVSALCKLIDIPKENAQLMRRATYLILGSTHHILDLGFESQMRTVVDQERLCKEVISDPLIPELTEMINLFEVYASIAGSSAVYFGEMSLVSPCDFSNLLPYATMVELSREMEGISSIVQLTLSYVGKLSHLLEKIPTMIDGGEVLVLAYKMATKDDICDITDVCLYFGCVRFLFDPGGFPIESTITLRPIVLKNLFLLERNLLALRIFDVGASMGEVTSVAANDSVQLVDDPDGDRARAHFGNGSCGILMEVVDADADSLINYIELITSMLIFDPRWKRWSMYAVCCPGRISSLLILQLNLSLIIYHELIKRCKEGVASS